MPEKNSTLAVEWAYQLDPIQKVYTNQGEQDQVENTIQFAKLQHQIN
jgi:hypothetical protein